MTRSEVLDFLELPSGSTDKDIIKRGLEKRGFFELLLKSSPSQVLKNLHSRNLEKTNAILAQSGYTNASSSQASELFLNSQPIIPKSHQKDLNVIAWLIRHTEGIPTKSFQLFLGSNVIGRERHTIHPTILLDNDVYISRYHANLEIVSNPVLSFYITDGLQKQSKNGTYINSLGIPIKSRTKLNENDTIQVGITKLVLKMNQRAELTQLEKVVEESEYMETVIINI